VGLYALAPLLHRMTHGAEDVLPEASPTTAS